MKNQWKTILIFCCLFSFYSSGYAQLKLGPGLAFGTGIENIGITAKGHYSITEIWDGAASFTFFLTGEDAPGVDLNVWEFNVDAHYIISSNQKFTFYPLAGLSIAGVSIDFNTGFPGLDGKNTATELGINLGAGIELNLTESISGVAEANMLLVGLIN